MSSKRVTTSSALARSWGLAVAAASEESAVGTAAAGLAAPDEAGDGAWPAHPTSSAATTRKRAVTYRWAWPVAVFDMPESATTRVDDEHEGLKIWRMFLKHLTTSEVNRPLRHHTSRSTAG